MAFPTVREILNDTITMMGQVSGSAVQQYTEPMALIGINRIFEYLYNKREWDHLWDWQTGVLDGVTGRISGDITLVTQSSDITKVIDVQTGKTIPFPISHEHLLTYTSGAQTMYRTELPWNDEDYNTKYFKFWPVTAAGTLGFWCGHRPATFDSDSQTVPMDKTLMVNGVVWWMLADDGTNPASADKAQVLFDKTFQDIVARVGAKQIGAGAGYRNGTVVISS